MTPTLRVRDPQELLALIPYQLGFQPRESAVVVSLREPQRRVGLVMRVDLADLAAPDDGPQVARSMVAHVARDGGRDTVLVVYTDQLVAPDDHSPAWRAAEHYLGAAQVFLGSVDVWVVSATGYSALGCTDARCCPPGGRPLADLSATVVGAEMVLAGAVVMATRDELARIPRAGDADRRRTNAAANRWRQRAREAHDGADQGAGLVQWRQAGFATWRAALAGEMTPASLGRIEAALDDIAVRDAVLLSLVPGTGGLPETYLDEPLNQGSLRTTAAVGRAMSAIVEPGAGVRPEDDLSSAALRVLEGVVAHGRRRHQAPALTLLALLTWWRGSTARSEALLERAYLCDPGYRLARLLTQALEAGMAPGWARGPDR